MADIPPSSKGTLWVFTIGVSQYRNSMINLEFADNDAETLAATLAERANGIFDKVNTRVLLNDQVTNKSIIEGLNSFFGQAGSSDTGLIALMGHGVIADGTFYFVPYPADLSNLASEGLAMTELEKALQKISLKLKRTVLMLDTCHAGALDFRVRDLDQMVTRHAKARGISLETKLPETQETYILNSSYGDENSWEDANYKLPGEKKGHGAFTYGLLRGLNGEAAHNGDTIDILNLFVYTRHEVPVLTGGKQHPDPREHGGGFDLARVRSVPPADQQQATALTQNAVRAQKQGNPKEAQTLLARADELNPNNQVSRVLHDEVTADIDYSNDPKAEHDVIAETAKLIKNRGKLPSSDPSAPRPLVIAFLDFNTLGGPPELAGLHEALVARISQALQASKRVHVVDRHLLDQTLREMKLSMTDLSDPDTRLRVGRMLVARLIGTGDVVFLGKNKYIINLQMFDTETTEITVNLSETGSDAEHILQVAEKVESDIITKLTQNYPLRGKIAALDGDQVILDIGAKVGATVGTLMDVVTEEPIRINGEVVGKKLNNVGSMEIREVQEKVSFAKVLDHKTALTVGTNVIQSSKVFTGVGAGAPLESPATPLSSGG